MRFVVDSNVLFTYFWKGSVFRNAVEEESLKFFAPEFALMELKKHTPGILAKTGLKKTEFNQMRAELFQFIEFFAYEAYTSTKNDAKKALEKLSKDDKEAMIKDLDFICLAIKTKSSLWSNDKLLKKQHKIFVFNTHEIVQLLG